ncbi:hypothetical protein [Corallococcus interemptor]|uniref:hypothetical protein n=1 Tax=Corallococcus interemptor TaxID=2316720 RepID=UPI0011C4238A|nr:hypothetical protein [Corallococcus interemptor]
MAETSWEQQAALVAEALNLLTVLAAPRLYAGWSTQAPPAALREALDTRLLALAAFCEQASGSPDAERFRAAAPQVRALADKVLRMPSGSLSTTDWLHPSRECLDALGFHAPPEGWDAFEGWPE